MGSPRRKKLVDPFQYRLITRIVIYWAIYQVTLWNFMFCWRLLQQGHGSVFEQYSQFIWEFYPMLFCFLFLVPAFAWDAVKFYHRVAGPIYRFKTTMREIAAEQPVRRIKLRKGDELVDMQDVFNAMLDTLVQHGAVTLIDDGRTSDESTSGQTTVLTCDAAPEDPAHAST